MAAPVTPKVDLGTGAEVADFVAALTSRLTAERRTAKRITTGSSLEATLPWRGAVYVFHISQDEPRIVKRAKKDPNVQPRPLSNYNAFLRTTGLFERLCKDLHVNPEGERSFRERLAAVDGADENSPWITVARNIWYGACSPEPCSANRHLADEPLSGKNSRRTRRPPSAKPERAARSPSWSRRRRTRATL
jgi:hypothetical protein